MTQEEFYKLRMLMAQASAASLERQLDEYGTLFDLATRMASHLWQFAPDGFDWPADIQADLEAAEAEHNMTRFHK